MTRRIVVWGGRAHGGRRVGWTRPLAATSGSIPNLGCALIRIYVYARELSAQLGRDGREHVREHFLLPRLLMEELELLVSLSYDGPTATGGPKRGA
jgi:hypothetical protein